MAIVYSRLVAADVDADSFNATVKHVCEHLSSVASLTDSQTEHADQVLIFYEDHKDGTLIRGELGMQPKAPYLRDDFDPEQDVADNPLSVTSIAAES
jgi:hypothetical protein